MLNKNFTRAILPLLLAAGCSAANAGVLSSQAAAMATPKGSGATTNVALPRQGVSHSSEMHQVQAPDAVAQQANANFIAVGGTIEERAARFQPLPVDVPALPSPPPIPVSEPFTAAILGSGLALMALLKRKERRKQA